MSKYIFISPSNPIKSEFINQDELEIIEFGGISKVNLFIGANNSRKSRLMRYLLKMNHFNVLSNNIHNLLFSLESSFEPILSEMNEKYLFKMILRNKGELDGYENDDELSFIKNLTNSDINRDIKIDKSYFINYLYKLKNPFKEEEIDFDSFKNQVNEFILLLLFLLNFKRIHKAGYSISFLFRHIGSSNLGEFENQLELVKKPIEILKRIALINFIKYEPLKIYIPTLRSAISIYSEKETIGSNEKETIKINDDIFKSTISHHYKLVEDIGKLEITTGLDLFKKIKKNRNSIREVRNKFTEFENFLKLNFFEDKEIDIVALEEDNNHNEHIKIYIKGEPDRDLHDLGDGIQSLITILYPIFMAKEGSWIFVEEPELNMHPGLQHLFLKTILFNENLVAKKLKYFITSHSNHILNLSIPYDNLISVFAFEKVFSNKSLYSKVTQIIGNDTKILDLLGVYNSSVFMANCSIWVEGVSDRRYLKAFLAAYIKENGLIKFHEDLHYSFFEYAGTNLQHYLFEQDEEVPGDLEKIKAHFLSNKVFLLADQDKSSWKQDKHRLYKSWIKNKFYYHTTGALEIENTLSMIILKDIFINVLKFSNLIVDKVSFIEADYRNHGLGSFITNKIKKRVEKFPSIKEKNGETLTTAYKNKFSKYVLENVETGNISWSDISANPDARELTERLYEFIKKQNSTF